MYVTLDIKLTLICLLLVALFVLVIYLIIMAKHGVQTIKNINVVLEDTAEITKIASERAVEVDGIVENVSEAVADIADAMKGQKSVIGAFSNLIKACGSLAAMVNKDSDDDSDEKESTKKESTKKGTTKKEPAKKAKSKK